MISIQEVLTRDVITIKIGTPVYEALNILTKNRVSGAPVVDHDHRLVGMLSERDLLKILIEKAISVHDLVDDYMSRRIVSFKETDDAVDICRTFIHCQFRRIPIVRDGKLVGIISRKDCVAAIAEAQKKLEEFYSVREADLRFAITEKERQRMRNQLARRTN